MPPPRNTTRPKAPACTRHQDTCPRHSHEHPCIHTRPGPQQSDSNEDEGYESCTFQPETLHECALHSPSTDRYNLTYSSEMPKYIHCLTTPPVSGTCARTTMHTSHTIGGGKCVRFSDEEVSRTVSLHYSTNRSQSCVDHLYHTSQQYAHPPIGKIPKDSRPCSRTVWGPPLPKTYSRYEGCFRFGN